MGISNNPIRPSFQVQRRRGEKRPRVELGLRVHDESRPRRNRVERWRLTLGLTLGRRTCLPLARLPLRLPVGEEMLWLFHPEVLQMLVRRCRIRVRAVGGVGTGGSTGTELVLLLLRLGVGSCLRLSFRAGLLLCLRLCLSLGLKSPQLCLLLPEALYVLVTDAGTAVRTGWGHRRLRVPRGSLMLYWGARLSLHLGRRPGLLKGVKMVELWDRHRCHCRVP